MNKTYSLSEIRKVVCWPSNSEAAVELLTSHGIMPQAEVPVGSRVFRMYDESAMESAKILRQAHDEDVKARRAAHAAAIRDKKLSMERAQAEAAPKSARAQRSQAEVQALSTLVVAATTLMRQVEVLNAKLDALAAQHSLPVQFDDEAAR